MTHVSPARVLILVAGVAAVFGSSPARVRAGVQEPEAHTLSGAPLYRPSFSADTKARLEADLARARAEFDQGPRDAERIIWLGRRLGYLGRYREAIEVYSTGIALHPGNPKLYRHRGHRFISVRDFDRAIADFEKAATFIKGKPDEIEPDGAPNKFNKPRSTLQSNIWYHLGLAYYLKGDFERALPAYLECMKVSMVNDDSIVAASDWLYMTYRRLGRTADAVRVLEPIRETMDILENDAYHKRLLMYKGLIQPETLLKTEGADDLQIATQGYGVGNWYLVNGDKARARQIFERVLQGSSWSAFGFIAAEADLHRGL
jgi:tetratricopeptide (TPR) repeat protein